MGKSAAYFVSLLTGAVISVMVVANTELGRITSNEVSLIINQSIGVILTSLILLVGRKSPVIAPPRRSAKWYMWFGGLFGVFVMIFNFYSVMHIGASLAMAAAVFGQSATGLVLDLFGLAGMQKRKISPLKWLALLISFAGIAVMSLSQDGTWALAYIIMGVAAGVLTMLQLCYNSAFAAAKGAIFSARQNALSGLLGTLAYAFILLPVSTLEGFTRLPGTPVLTIVLGGVLAIFVVTSSNIIIPKIPAVYSSLLLSAGQILMSLVLDTLLYSSFSAPLLVGALVMLAGMLVNFLADRKAASGE